jgi:hypothetical protein
MKNQRTLLAAASLAAVLALSGCWDDDDNTDAVAPPPVDMTEVPDSAGVSIGAFFSFILGLAANDEKSEPLTIKTTFAVPADEAAEPTPLP